MEESNKYLAGGLWQEDKGVTKTKAASKKTLLNEKSKFPLICSLSTGKAKHVFQKAMYKHSVKTGVFPMPAFLPTMEGWLTQEDHKFKASLNSIGRHCLKTNIKKEKVVVCEDTDTKPGSLSLIPRTHVVEETSCLLQVVL